MPGFPPTIRPVEPPFLPAIGQAGHLSRLGCSRQQHFVTAYHCDPFSFSADPPVLRENDSRNPLPPHEAHLKYKLRNGPHRRCKWPRRLWRAPQPVASQYELDRLSRREAPTSEAALPAIVCPTRFPGTRPAAWHRGRSTRPCERGDCSASTIRNPPCRFLAYAPAEVKREPTLHDGCPTSRQRATAAASCADTRFDPMRMQGRWTG